MFATFKSEVPKGRRSDGGAPAPVPADGVNEAGFALGPLVLDAHCQVLLRDRVPLRIGERAVSILLSLVENAGSLVTKQHLIDRVWHGQFVEDSNLTVQIAALRRVLADEADGAAWIVTMPRRGYRYVGPIERLDDLADLPVSGMYRDPAPTIAVLPFRSSDQSGIPGYFAGGLVEEIISMLAGLKEVTVMSRGSTLKYRRQIVSARDVGRELGVDYVVSGSMRQGPVHNRLIADLTDTASDAVLWSQAFDARDRDVFDAQDRIVARIVHTLAPRVREAELRRVRTQRPEDMGAYHLVLQARELIYRLERPSFDQAEPLLRRAIERDPRYAAAWFLLGRWHSLRLGNGWSENRAADTSLVEEYVRQAIALDANNAQALAYYGHTRARLWRDYDAALGFFERAAEIAPNEAGVWGWSSATFSYLGDGDEGVRRAERALSLSPLDPFAHHFRGFLCLAHYTNGSFDEAIRHANATMLEQPTDSTNLRYLAAALAALGRSGDARMIVERILTIQPDLRVGPSIESHPYRDPARRIELGARLIEAGLPA